MRPALRSALVALGLSACAFGQAQPFAGGPALDEAIQQAIRLELIPGAVLLVGHNGRVIYNKVYGERALVPAREAMTLDTIFDAASLTKVVATTPSIMKLFEQGKVRMNDRVTQYLPEFQGGASEITVRNLMTHFSGLRPDVDLNPKWRGYDLGIRLALADPPVAPPGVRFIYSDTNFELLGEIVHRVSGRMLNDFARQEIYIPLGMKDSMFNPPASLLPRIAPTEVEHGRPVRGVVHDPQSRAMDGVAGHAGLFTTAADLARYAQMLLNGGELNGVRIFSPLTVRKFTTPETPADQPILRGFGWDIDSPYSSNRGELFPIGSYGHTGFTGTSVWIDPTTKTYVILLTNSVHPRRGKNLTPLRSKVATVVAASLGIDLPGVAITGYNETIIGAGLHSIAEPNEQIITGLDSLAGQNFALLRGKRIGLITNQTGVNRQGQRNIDLMVAAGIKLTAIFSPEHGLSGSQDTERIQDAVDAASGVPIHSLYLGSRRRMTPEMLKDVDALVFDIQDVGARFYTYSCTLLYALEAAAKFGREFYVLDRPNPITGVHMEGPILDNTLESFVGCFEMPVRHGMTFGEMARMMSGQRKLGVNLKVIAMQGWNRGDWFDSTGLTWIDPSPNMRSLNAALLYPGIAMLEAAKNYSVGRGTEAPFEQIGADWINGNDLATYLNKRLIPGVRAYATRFRPAAGSNFGEKLIEGVRFVITDRNSLDSVRLGLEIGSALQKLYPGRMDFEVNRFLIGNRRVIEALQLGQDPRSIIQELEESLRDFARARTSYLIYR